VPLGVAFVPLAGRPLLALLVLGLAGLSDMLDGWVARRRPHPNSWGPWLDPLCDKAFIILVITGLYLAQDPPLHTTLPMVTRELAILLLYLLRFLVPSMRGMRYDYHAHPVGKATTVAQFLTVAALVLGRPETQAMAMVCAGLGLLCAVTYARRGRALAHAQKPKPDGAP
jgi:cardiolipin synthase